MNKKKVVSLGLAVAILITSLFKASDTSLAETPANFVQVNGQNIELPNLEVDLPSLDDHLQLRQELLEHVPTAYTETIHFPAHFANEGTSYLERTRQRLELTGLSLDFLESLSQEQLEVIAMSSQASVQHSYFQEVGNDENSELAPISRASFQEYSQNAKTPSEIADYIVEQIQVGDYVDIDPLGIDTGWRAHHVGHGVVHIITVMFHQPFGNAPGRYVAAAEFMWSNMPSHRGTDFFALGRGSGLSVLENGSFSGFTQQREYRRRLTAYVNFIHHNSFGTTHHPSIAQHNELGTINQGAGIRVNQRGDILPPFTMVAGSTFMMSQFYGLRGGVTYIGTLSSFSPGEVQTRTHYVSYLHQIGTSWFGSPTLSVGASGLSFSISASPSANFAHPVQNNLSVTWRS